MISRPTGIKGQEPSNAYLSGSASHMAIFRELQCEPTSAPSALLFYLLLPSGLCHFKTAVFAGLRCVEVYNAQLSRLGINLLNMTHDDSSLPISAVWLCHMFFWWSVSLTRQLRGDEESLRLVRGFCHFCQWSGCSLRAMWEPGCCSCDRFRQIMPDPLGYFAVDPKLWDSLPWTLGTENIWMQYCWPHPNIWYRPTLWAVGGSVGGWFY